jgi:hypothetical protein
MIWAALEVGTAGKVDGFNRLPATPSKTGKAITFGIQTKFSNLFKKIKRGDKGKINMYQCINLYPQRVTCSKPRKKTREL